MSTVRANGVTLHVEQIAPTGGSAAAGGGAAAGGAAAAGTVVLLHGLVTDTLASWYFTLARPLAEAGFRVVMFDLRGHGRSERPPRGYRLADFVGDLAALLPALGLDRPVHLLGNSFGGTIALAYAARHPARVAGLGLIESEPPVGDWSARMGETLGAALRRLPVPGALEQIEAAHGAYRARIGRRAARLLQETTLAADLPASGPLTADDLTAVRCPALAVYAGDSDVAGRSAAHRLLPRLTTAVLAGTRHTVLVDRPDLVYPPVMQWLGAPVRPTDLASHTTLDPRPPAGAALVHGEAR